MTCAKNAWQAVLLLADLRVVVSLGARGELMRKTFPTVEAKKWRARHVADKSDSCVQVPSRMRLDAAATEYIDGIKAATARDHTQRPAL